MNIAIVLTARPSWAKLSTICRALQQRPDVTLQILACTSALLPEFGDTAAQVEREGFTIAERIYCSYAGSTLETSSKETGALLIELSSAFRRLRPDVVLVMADRHEVLAAAQAAAQLHLPLVHCQGGERTGSIDDKIRDAITQLADVHCVCTERAKFRVYSLTGSEAIHHTGCPSIDLALESRDCPPVTAQELGGVNPDGPFLLLLQHPVTTEAASFAWQMAETTAALELLRIPVLWFQPGADAGRVPLAKAITSLPPNRFLRLMQQAACVVGNSSAGIRESSALGVPVVDIGSRQFGRERARNVQWSAYDAESIAHAIMTQLAHGPYEPSALYGTGHSGTRIAEVLCQMS